VKETIVKKNCQFNYPAQFPQGFFVGLTITLLFASFSASASNDFTCNKKAKVCHLEDTSIVMGDRVEFYTADGEVIATGRVTKMNGIKRTVELDEINGDVQLLAKTYSNAEGSAGESSGGKLSTYVPPGKIQGAIHFGLANLGRGDASGFEISGEGILANVLGNLDLQAQASWYHFSGTSVNIYDDGATGAFKANAFALTGGPTLSFHERGPIIVRTEVGIGFAYMKANIDDSATKALSTDWGYKIKSGIGLHLRGLIAIGLKLGPVLLELGYEPAMLAGAATNTIVLGAVFKIK
jgi:hypothetical protein